MPVGVSTPRGHQYRCAREHDKRAEPEGSAAMTLTQIEVEKLIRMESLLYMSRINKKIEVKQFN